MISPQAAVSSTESFSHHAMACNWELVLCGEEPSYARQVADTVFAEVDRLEEELSRFIPDSDIGRLNALTAGESLRLGVDSFECLKLALVVKGETGGAFEVARGCLQLNTEQRSVTVGEEGAEVDLGGLGKGFALDRAVALLGDWGVSCALLHSGQSSLMALGCPHRGSGWKVELRDPQDHSRALGSVTLRGASLSGSGTEIHGNHIRNPHSGEPAQGVVAAWAQAPTAALSDALSTSFRLPWTGDTRAESSRFASPNRISDRSDMSKLAASKPSVESTATFKLRLEARST